MSSGPAEWGSLSDQEVVLLARSGQEPAYRELLEELVAALDVAPLGPAADEPAAAALPRLAAEAWGKSWLFTLGRPGGASPGGRGGRVGRRSGSSGTACSTKTPGATGSGATPGRCSTGFATRSTSPSGAGRIRPPGKPSGKDEPRSLDGLPPSPRHPSPGHRARSPGHPRSRWINPCPVNLVPSYP